MEKQRSFSVKPVRYLAFSFTISFSVFFLIFFSTWILKSTSHNLRVADVTRFEKRESEVIAANELTGNSSFTPSGKNVAVDDFNASYTTKSIVNDSVIPTGDNVDSSIRIAADVTSSEKRESEVTAVNVLTGNSSFTPSGENVVVDDFSVSYSTKSAVNDTEGLNSEIPTGDNVNGGIDTGNVVISDASQRSSIRKSLEHKHMVDCDVTKGRWVFGESYPLYTNVTCPIIDEGFNCEANGRLDKDYMKWRWQPQDCDLPRFDATKMLELIRGKRLVFVGDSINRNQWESMLCLLMGAVKDPKKVYEARGRKITKERNNYCFKFEDYKCTLEFYVSHFLVHESKARIGKKRAPTLRIDAIDRGSSRWRGADILVFNTAHWWNHHKTKAGINYYQERDQVYPQLDVTKAFQRALSTWASWVDKNINPHKTRIFFRSSSPSHFSGGLWNTGGHCKEAFRPLNETFTSIYPERNLIVEETLRQMKTPVTFLNITRLSDYRPDAHPSMYGRKSVNPGVQDCSHWCLPGVPDNWNELLYYYLLSSTKASFVD